MRDLGALLIGYKGCLHLIFLDERNGKPTGDGTGVVGQREKKGDESNY